MTIQTQQIEQSDHWHSFMANVLKQWDGVLQDQGINPANLVLVECSHCSTDPVYHAYVVMCETTSEKIVLYFEENNDRVYVPAVGDYREMEWDL